MDMSRSLAICIYNVCTYRLDVYISICIACMHMFA